MEMRILKSDPDRRLVFGWGNISVTKSGESVTDAHDHQIPPDVLEDAAYTYVLNYREGDEMHTSEVKCHLVESFFSSPEKLVALGLAEDALPTGWWVGFYVDDDGLWDKVKKGTYTMFSIAGVGRIEEVD